MNNGSPTLSDCEQAAVLKMGRSSSLSRGFPEPFGLSPTTQWPPGWPHSPDGLEPSPYVSSLSLPAVPPACHLQR
jgi:hypothetical protein